MKNFYERLDSFMVENNFHSSVFEEIKEYKTYLGTTNIQNENSLIEVFYLKFKEIEFLKEFFENELRVYSLKNKNINEELTQISQLFESDFKFLTDKYTIVQISESYRYNGSIINTINELYSHFKNSNNQEVVKIVETLNKFLNDNYLDLVIIEKLNLLNSLPSTSPERFLLRLEESLYDFIRSDKTNEKIQMLVENLNNYNNLNITKQLIYVLNEKMTNNREIFNVYETSDIKISKLYSFSRTNPLTNKIYFTDSQNVFEMTLTEKNIRVLNNIESDSYLDLFELNRFINFGNNIISENEIKFKINNNNLNFVFENDSWRGFWNDTATELNEISGLIKRQSLVEKIQNVNLLIKIVENLNNLVSFDFSNVIVSPKSSASTTIFKIDENYFAVINDFLNGKNIILKDINSEILIEELKEHMSIDISNILNEKFSNDSIEKVNLMNKIDNIKTEISELNVMRNSVKQVLESNNVDAVYLEELTELMEKITGEINKHSLVLENEIHNLKNINRVGVKIENNTITEGQKIFGHLAEKENINTIPRELVPNLKVHCIEYNIEGNVIGIQTISNSFSVLAKDGREFTFKISEFGKTVKSIDSDIETDIEALKNKASEVEDEEKIKIGESLSGKSTFSGYGVEGNFSSQNKTEDLSNSLLKINDNVKLFKDDVEKLTNIISKLENTENTLKDVTDVISTFQKINNKPIENLIAQITNYKEQISHELEKLA